jgi:hypothetical protein
VNDIITLDGVKELWTLPGKRPPSTTTIWHYRRQGRVPQPIKAGRDNLYRRSEVVRLRNRHLGLPPETDMQ